MPKSPVSPYMIRIIAGSGVNPEPHAKITQVLTAGFETAWQLPVC